ncbi:MAG: TrmH family RNA methyltransferase [Candidatus Kapaibacteriales bacterium]
MIFITSIEDPRVYLYRSLRYTPFSHIENRLFIAEGAKLVLRLLQSNLKIHSIFAIKEFIEEFQELILSRIENPNTQLFTAEKKLMENIVGFHLHSGIMAIAFQPLDCSLEDFSNVIVALNSINNSDNVGLIVRTMRAFGVDSLLVDEHSTSPYLRRAVRVSMGNVFDIKVHHAKNFKNELNYLKHKHYLIISAEITEKSLNLSNFVFPDKFVLIFGNEGKGIETSVLELSDYVVEIPIEKNVESINVALSTGIFLYEHQKQLKKNVTNARHSNN